MGFHWGLSDSKSPRVFRTLQTILADFGRTVYIGSSSDFRSIFLGIVLWR